METRKSVGLWVILVVVGALMLLILFEIINSTFPPKELNTKEKITPEWKLITDGKSVDTVWVYKIK